jgi:membrane associated rhomboid family serine protease
MSDHDENPSELEGGPRPSWGTSAVLFINIAVGLVMAASGVPILMAGTADLVAFGAVDPTRIWNGDVWRLATACFVHVGAWHLGLNMWVLWQLGRVLERLVGTGRFLLIYVVSGWFGFALSVALQPGLTAGASGAVFGATGGLLAVAAVARHKALGRFLVASLVPFVVATFALGFLMPMVNNVAHFGGLVMGFALGYGLASSDVGLGSLSDDGTIIHEHTHRRRWFGASALALSLVAFAVVSVAALDPRYSPRYHVIMGLKALHTIQLRQIQDPSAMNAVLAHETSASRLGKDDPETLLLRARLAEVQGDAAAARALAGDAFRRAARGDRTATFEHLVAALGILEPQSAMPYADGYTTRLLCHVALDGAVVDAAPVGAADDDTDGDADGPRALKAPVLKNACAWLFVRANEMEIRDPARAVILAREASAEAPGNAAIVHTLATSLGDAGNAAEGLALLERLTVSGDTSLGVAFLRSERTRLATQAAAQAAARSQTQAQTPAPVAETPSPPEASLSAPDPPVAPPSPPPGGETPAEG